MKIEYLSIQRIIIYVGMGLAQNILSVKKIFRNIPIDYELLMHI